MGFKVAIVGATGNVGREMLNILEERGFPADEVVALASRRSQGTEVSYGDRTLKVKTLDTYDFSDTDICIMSAGGNVSKEWSPKIGRQGCVVIDNSSAWRYDQDVPLIVPEVNPDAISLFTRKNIIANPNCSTAQLVVALKPLHDFATIKRIVVATYQSVSGAGKEGMDELFTQTRAVFVANSVEVKKFTKRIAFNVIPAHRRLPRRRLDQGRVEDDGRDQEDARPEDQADRDLRARAGVHRPFRGRQHRVREADLGRRGARHPARRPGLHRHRQARRGTRRPSRVHGRRPAAWQRGAVARVQRRLAADRRCRPSRPACRRRRARPGAGVHKSLRRLLELPDLVVFFPSHYGGSVCGRGLSGNPFSSIGFERAHNPLLALADPEAFADALLAEMPPRPVEQERIVAANRSGRVGALA